jgi:hypothetical protein
MIDRLKSFFLGQKCSVCNIKMQRDIDEWYQRNGWEVFIEYECLKCHSYIRERNYKWVSKSYALIDDYYLHISAHQPNLGDIYEPMSLEGISYGIATISINDIYISAVELKKINKLVYKIILLS